MTDRNQPTPPSSVWQITGVLHAGAVRDGHLPLVIHPDGGGLPVPMSYGSDQLTTLRLCLCRRIAVEGTQQPDPTGAPVFRLTAVMPMPGVASPSVSGTPAPAVSAALRTRSA